MTAHSEIETAANGDTRDRQCETHGAYPQTFISREPGRGFWMGRCEPCHAERQAESERRQRLQTIWELHGAAQIPERYRHARFGNCAPTTALQRAAMKTCREYVDGADDNIAQGVCLTLVGPPGTGKTYLLCAIAHALIEERVQRVRYASMADLLATVKGCWAWHGDSDAAQCFVRARVLLLDEVWMPTDERARESMMTVLDVRYRQRFPTLIATNLTAQQLTDAFGERFVDRLREGGRVLPLDGKSMRSACT